MFKSNANILVIGLLLILCLTLFSFWGCEDKKDTDPCEGLPPDSCQVDTCVGDTCSSDSCAGLVGEWEFLGLAGENVSAIAIHPTDARVIFVGTAFNFSDGILSKLFRTRNCGITWDTLLISSSTYSDLDIDPSNPNVIYAVPHEIVKSTDGGNTWANASQGIYLDWETRVYEMVIDPNNTNTLYAGTGGFFGGDIYKSTNGGESWTSIGTRIELKGTNTALAVDAQNNIVYVGHNNGSVLKTTNGGLSWDTTAITRWGHIVEHLYVDPETGLYACIGPLGIWNSTDVGANWSDLNEGLFSYSSVKVENISTANELFALSYRPGIEVVLFNKQLTDSSWTKFKVLREGNPLGQNDFVITPDHRQILTGPYGLYRYTFP